MEVFPTNFRAGSNQAGALVDWSTISRVFIGHMNVQSTGNWSGWDTKADFIRILHDYQIRRAFWNVPNMKVTSSSRPRMNLSMVLKFLEGHLTIQKFLRLLISPEKRIFYTSEVKKTSQPLKTL